MVTIGEHLRLQGQVGPAGIHEVQAREPVLKRDLLRPEMLLDGLGEVAAALHGRVVGHDDAQPALDGTDSRDDAGTRRLAVVHPVRRERRELQERGPGIEQPVDPLPDQELAARAVTGERRVVAGRPAIGDRRRPGPQLAYQTGHRGGVRLRLGRGGIQT